MIFSTLINVTVQVSLTFYTICPGATTCCKRLSTIGTLKLFTEFAITDDTNLVVIALKIFLIRNAKESKEQLSFSFTPF